MKNNQGEASFPSRSSHTPNTAACCCVMKQSAWTWWTMQRKQEQPTEIQHCQITSHHITPEQNTVWTSKLTLRSLPLCHVTKLLLDYLRMRTSKTVGEEGTWKFCGVNLSRKIYPAFCKGSYYRVQFQRTERAWPYSLNGISSSRSLVIACQHNIY